MNETALMVNDLYESLCFVENIQNVEYERKLLKLHRFFTAFIKCWQQDESCPRIPQNIQDGTVCDFVKNSLLWLSNQGQPQVTRMFKSLIANNVNDNMALLEQYGVTSDDINDIDNLVNLEDPDAFYEKMQYITEQLMTPGKTGMTLLGLMASLKIHISPQNLEPGDILFVNDNQQVTIINPITAKYVSLNNQSLPNPTPITTQIQLFVGEFLINDSSSLYKMKSNIVDRSVFALVDSNGFIELNGTSHQLIPNPNLVIFIIQGNIVQLDLFNGEIIIFGDPDVYTVFNKTNQETQNGLSVYIGNQLYEVSLFSLLDITHSNTSSATNEELQKTQRYMDKLNFIEDSIPLDLTSPSLL
jgi:hypothetical protein